MIAQKRVFLFTLVCGLLLPGCTLLKKISSGESAAKPSEKGQQTFSENCIHAHAVVTYYLNSGRTYLTEQQHTFCPESKSLQIRAHEPQGTFTWNWTEQHYSTTTPSGLADDAYWDPPQILAVYAGFLYGGEFLSANALPEQAPLKLEGQRYIPLVLAIPSEDMNVLLYRNQNTQKIDVVQVQDRTKNQVWLGKFYNWSYYSPKGLLIPRTIDIFDISEGISSKKLMIRVDYKQVP